MARNMKSAAAFIIGASILTTGFHIQAAVLVAKPTSSIVYVNGAEKKFAAYNIGGSNYFKLRDLAYVVNGTDKEFNVVWDAKNNTIQLYSGQAYQPVGDELTVPEQNQDKGAATSNTKVAVNGQKVDFAVYNINGSSYFKLRDVMESFNIGLTWNQISNAIEIDTSDNYIPSASDGQRPEKELSAQEVYNKCATAIFYIETYDMDRNPLYSGSGFFINGSGRAVTNYHVLKDAFYATITMTNDAKFEVEGVLGYNIDKDVAVIQVKGSGFSYLKQGNSNKMTGGEQIYTIGSPYGLSNTITEGIISNPNRNWDGVKLIQISAPISSGSSGGALLNTKGEAIGITSSAIADAQNLNFAVAIEEVKALSLNESVLPLSQVAAEKDIYIYEQRPEAFQYVVAEIEPNNTIEKSQKIENGMSVQGVLDDIYIDSFYTRCNTTGTIEIYCSSDSPYFEDMVMLMDSLEADKPLQGKFFTLEEDNVKWLYMNYRVEKPGIYTMSLFSDSGLKDNPEGIDYLFYYEFTPDGIK